jgi:hypothetical protein
MTTDVERSPQIWLWDRETEADDGGRTRDLKLGKLALYQLSYVRACGDSSSERGKSVRRG